MRGLVIALCLGVIALLPAWAADPFESAPTTGPDPFRSAPVEQPAKPAPRPRPVPESEPVVVMPPPPPPARLPAAPDGEWIVDGAASIANRDCGHWVVRILASKGQLSGSVSVGSGMRELRPSALGSDGSFNVSTTAGRGKWGNQNDVELPIYTVIGKVVGDLISLTLKVSGAKCNLERSSQGRRVAR